MIIKDFLLEEYLVHKKTQKQIAEDQNLPLDTIEYLFRILNLQHLKPKIKFCINEDKIDVSSPIFMYYVGLIATDGYVQFKNNYVALRLEKNSCQNVFKELSNYFEYNGKLFTYGNNLELRITSIKLIEVLLTLGIPIKDKTFLLKTPTIFYNNNCLKMYLRGVHDGDGNCHRKFSKYTNKYIGRAWRLLTGSHDFINGICQLINKEFNFNLKLTINSRKNNKEYPQIVTSVKEGKKLLKWIYSDYESIKLEEKYQKYLSVIHEKEIV